MNARRVDIEVISHPWERRAGDKVVVIEAEKTAGRLAKM
jgi:hypothetical protein